MPIDDIYNFRKVNDLVFTGGQPTEEQLAAAASAGCEVVINLAPYNPGRSLPDEGATAGALGLTYYNIPVEMGNPTKADLLEFDRLMVENHGRRAFVHCMANYRVTAFLSLHAMKYWGWSRAEAESFIASTWRLAEYPVWERFFRREASERESKPAG